MQQPAPGRILPHLPPPRDRPPPRIPALTTATDLTLPPDGGGDDGAGRLARIAEHLEQQAWARCPDFVSPTLTGQLLADARAAQAAQQLRPATIGRRQRRHPQIRGDQLLWLDRGNASLAQQAYLDALDDLRIYLNRRLFLGLEEIEMQLAHYPAGHRYARHLDRVAGSDQRVVSTVFYLNPGWTCADGGALRLETAAGPQTILPQAGTLVVFLSAGMWHEVLPTRRERWSLTGWLRRRRLERPLI